MSEEPTGEWYLTVKGDQKGPVSWEELGHLVKAGAIHPRNDKVWQAGMENWVAAGEVEGLFERRKPEEEKPLVEMAATATTAAADGAGRMEVEDPYFHRDVSTPWPGVGRGGYIMGAIVLPVVGQLGIGFVAALASGVLGEEGAGWLAVGGIVVLVAIALYVVVQRFPNLGMTRWWVLGLLVPILNWWLNYRMLACPPGYAIHKKLDPIGWVLAILYWLMVLVVVVMLVAMIVMMGALLADPEAWQEMLKNLEAQAKQAGS